MRSFPPAVAAHPPLPPTTPLRTVALPSPGFSRILGELAAHVRSPSLAPHHTDHPIPIGPNPKPLDSCEDETRGRKGPAKTEGNPELRQESNETDWLDPSQRQLGLQPWWTEPPLRLQPAASPAPSQQAPVASFEHLFSSLVRRAAWSFSPDRRSATLRLEIGSGALEGCAITICADPQELQIALDAPAGLDVEAWKNHLRQRLASAGLVASFS